MKSYILFSIFTLLTLSSSAHIFEQDYNTGTYYTTNGEKHTGLIAVYFIGPAFLRGKDNRIYFKTDSNAKKQEIKASTLKSFVIENKQKAGMDSFVVVHNPEISRIKFDYDFLRVVLDKEPVKLYQYYCDAQSGPTGTFGGTQISTSGDSYMRSWYFYGTADANTVAELKEKNFKKVMSEMLADEPGTVAWILDRTYVLDDMDAVLNDYKVRQAKHKRQ